MIASAIDKRANISVDDTLATVDFVTGVYSVAGAPLTAADVVDQPELITPGTGLVIPDSGSVVALLGDVLTAVLAANYTLVIAWDHGTSTGRIYPLVLADDSVANMLELYRADSGGGRAMAAQESSGSHLRETVDFTAVGDGAHTLALTVQTAVFSFSVDGRAVQTQYVGADDNFDIAVTAAAFGDFPGNTIGDTVTIKSLRLYTAVADALLPGLSS